jgi:large subunit ribosomal protein L10
VDRAEKSELVTAMNEVFKDAGSVVVAHYAGLSVAEMTAFRGKMRDAGASVKVAKNRLAKLALKGTDAETIADLLKGPTVIAYSKDPVAAPKIATEFAKGNDKLVILGGSLGRTSLNPEGIKALASLPSLDELRGRLVGMIVSPATRVAQVVAAPAAQVARVVGAYAKKSEAA